MLFTTFLVVLVNIGMKRANNMQIYFKSRELARKANFGKFKDNGKESPQGKRFARELTNVKGKANANK